MTDEIHIPALRRKVKARRDTVWVKAQLPLELHAQISYMAKLAKLEMRVYVPQIIALGTRTALEKQL